jgi:hypothetical protein
MAKTYAVSDGLTLAKKLGGGVPFTAVDLSVANIVNATMYKFFPWRDTLKTSGAGANWTEVALTDGAQDFATGLTDLYRMTQFWMTRTDTSPNQIRNITVAQSIPIDLVPKSPTAIRMASYQAGINKFRLESAVQVPSGTSWTLGGEYQPHPTKLTDQSSTFWFDDDHLEVFAKGLVYWAYKLANDARAGSMQTSDGRAVYTGALGEFMQAIRDMAANEDFGNIQGYYPDEPIGTVDSRRYYSNDVYPIL